MMNRIMAVLTTLITPIGMWLILASRLWEYRLSNGKLQFKEMKKTAKPMVGVVHVYIEEILRIASIPETPIITRLQSSDGEFPASISHSLPGVVGEDVETFGFAPDVADHEMLNDGGFLEAKPFITFGH